jgi:hypothetical protein
MIVPTAKINAIYPDVIQPIRDSTTEVKNQKERLIQPEEIINIIKINIDSTSILHQTEQKAVTLLQQLLKNYGYTSISIRFTNNKTQNKPR